MALSKNQEIDILSHIKETFDNYTNLSRTYRENMLDVYEHYSTFKQKRQADWQTTFKVNKAHEVINKILPRVMANNPRWVVSARTDEFVAEDKFLT
jgi:hypothetical protein